jgi:transposase
VSILADPPPDATAAPDPPPRPGTGPRFATPPWDRQTPAWLELDRRLPADHLARRIDRLVGQLDLGGLFASYAGTGSAAHRPDLLLKAALYETWRGQHRPADWHRDARESEPLRWLLLGCAPSRARWYAFRDRLGRHLPDWNRQVLKRAGDEQLTPARRAALDGSDLAAAASRHRLVNAATLQQRLARLDEAIAADAGGRPPAGVPGWMARRPAGRRRQRRRYRRAQERLDERRRHNRLRRREDRRPDDKVVISLSDPEAALGLDKLRVYRPLYNVQFVVDLDSPLVLAYEVLAQPTDAGALGPMLERARYFLGRPPEELLADAKYASGPQLALAEGAGVTLFDPWQAKGPGGPPGGQPPRQLPKEQFRWRVELGTYECPQGHLLDFVGRSRERRGEGAAQERLRYRCAAAHCRACPRRPECVRGSGGRTISRSPYEEQAEALRERMATAEAQALYRLRKQTVERGFADVKEHRGLRRLSGRGLARARVAVGLVVLAHNLLTAQSLRDRKQAVLADAGNPQRINI